MDRFETHGEDASNGPGPCSRFDGIHGHRYTQEIQKNPKVVRCPCGMTYHEEFSWTVEDEE